MCFDNGLSPRPVRFFGIGPKEFVLDALLPLICLVSYPLVLVLLYNLPGCRPKPAEGLRFGGRRHVVLQSACTCTLTNVEGTAAQIDSSQHGLLEKKDQGTQMTAVRRRSVKQRPIDPRSRLFLSGSVSRRRWRVVVSEIVHRVGILARALLGQLQLNTTNSRYTCYHYLS